MPTYAYRRDLERPDWMRVAGIAAGVGVGAALAAAYLARVMMQRVPLRDPGLSTSPAWGPDIDVERRRR